jgi:hypothetical protein
LVNETQLWSVIGEVDRGAQVGLLLCPGRLDQELATHAKVDDEALPMTIGGLKHQPEVLAATSSALHKIASQAICEIYGTGLMAPSDAGAEKVSTLDAATDDVVVQSSTDDLDLGKLRHPALGRRGQLGLFQRSWRGLRLPGG